MPFGNRRPTRSAPSISSRRSSAIFPSPPFRAEREGPSAQRWEGEVGIGECSGIPHLTPALAAPGGGEGVRSAWRYRSALLSLLAFVLGAILSISPLRAADFTPEQRKSIEAIIHDYLTKNPEVLLDALQAAEDKIKGEARDKAAQALTTRHREIFDDPETPVGGNAKGDVSLVEFFDYRCPYCKQVEPALEALLGEDRQLRLVYKEFPVLGADSVTASRAALAAKKQGKYDAFHRAMMTLKGQINEAAVFKTAESVGLDVERLKRDIASPEIARALKANSDLAKALDISGTPAFVIGDEIVPGAIDLASLKQMIATARKK
jgi:protein-disulfide isomerase